MANRNKTQKSVMTHQFSQVPKAEIQRSSFDRSHGLKTTFDAGYLYPILCDEALPGDSFNVNMTGFARLATPIFPIMDNMRMETFFFAVPNRLLWENWQKFNGEQINPGDTTDYLVPNISTGSSGRAGGTLEDYMGIPTDIPELKFNALWHRAYNLIWNEWFRDQNLQDSLPVPIDNGPDNITASKYEIQQRGKRHDYFTSCLPWPQKGDAVSIPLSGQAPVTGIGQSQVASNLTNETIVNADGSSITYADAWYQPDNTTPFIAMGKNPDTGFPDVFAQLSGASTITINSLREAFQIQRLLERDARGGTRYIEIIKAHFGVSSPDSRLQRPEYLGGGSTAINISPVAQTSNSSVASQNQVNTPQGNLAAVGTATLHNHGFNKSFTEHCTIIGLVSVRADLTYQQGLPRMFSRQTRYDFYWPALAHLGEQATLNKEIYAQGTTEDDEVFGYQERYAEYRYKPSMITGLMRSNAAGSLDAWHLSQDFASLPQLNNEFIVDNPPIDRVIAVPSEPAFIFDAHFSMRCARPMPLYGVPGLIDHF